jgi:hypothetical protein
MVAILMGWASSVVSAIAFGGEPKPSEMVRVAKAEFDQSILDSREALKELRVAMSNAKCASEDVSMYSVMLLRQIDEDD